MFLKLDSKKLSKAFFLCQKQIIWGLLEGFNKVINDLFVGSRDANIVNINNQQTVMPDEEAGIVLAGHKAQALEGLGDCHIP